MYREGGKPDYTGEAAFYTKMRAENSVFNRCFEKYPVCGRVYLCTFFCIFLGKRPELPPFFFLISPFLFTGAFKLSVAGQPDFVLQEGATKATNSSRVRTIKLYFFI